MATIKIHRGMDWPQLVTLPTGVTHDDYINVKVELIDAANKRIARFSKETLAGHEAIITEADATHLLIPIEQYWTSQLANGAYYIKIVYVYSDVRFADGDRDEGNSYYVFTVVAESEATNPEDVTVIAYGDHIEAGLMTGAQIVAAINEELESEDWQESGGDGGTSATNLSYTASATQGVVVSDTGNDATIPAATTENAGLLLPAGLTVLSATSGTNTGDETAQSIVNKIGNGTVIGSQYLPSYVDDVVEVANYAALPVTGDQGKIYVAIDTNYQYRWSGTAYVLIDNPLDYASQAEAEANTENTKVMTALRVFQNWVYNVANYSISALNTTSKTIVGAINELRALLLNVPTRKVGVLAVVNNDISIDFESLSEFVASNRVAASANFTISLANIPTTGFATLKVAISNLATATFPTGTISGDDRFSTLVWTPTENGNYTFSIYITGTEFELVASLNPAA